MGKKEQYKILEKYIVQNKEAHYRMAYSYVKNKDDALDIVQESIYKALNSVGKIENIQYIKTWFYRILINTALDFIRKNNRISYFDDMDFNADSKEDKYENFDLQNALDNLPPQYKTIIILRYFEDLKITDIAEILGENVNTIKTRLYSGLKKLRIELNDEEETYGKVKRA